MDIFICNVCEHKNKYEKFAFKEEMVGVLHHHLPDPKITDVRINCKKCGKPNMVPRYIGTKAQIESYLQKKAMGHFWDLE